MKLTLTQIIIFALLATLFSCATATPYGDVDQNGFGLKISKKEDPYFSLFKGNSLTSKETARRYSVLGALADCAEKNQYALITTTVDASATETSIASFSTTSMIGRTPIVQTNSYPVRETIPFFVSPYMCTSNLRRMGVPDKIEEASRELVNPTTKDMTGGVLIPDDVNIEGSLFKRSDIILSIGQVRIPDRLTFFKLKNSLPLGLQDVKIIREGKIKLLKVKVSDDTITIHNLATELWTTICRKIQSDGTLKTCEKVGLFLREQQKNFTK